MAYSEAQKEATLKLRKKKGIVRIALDMTETEREEYKAQASARGKSLKQYIVDLIKADMETPTP